MTDFSVQGVSENEALALVAGVEQLSEHPIATLSWKARETRGINACPARGFPCAERPRGAGRDRRQAACWWAAATFLPGHRRRRGTGKSRRKPGVQRRKRWCTLPWMDGAGIAAVADPIKESTPEAIAGLRRLGVRIVTLTGDSRRTADAVARQLGIDEAWPMRCRSTRRPCQAAAGRGAQGGDGG